MKDDRECATGIKGLADSERSILAEIRLAIHIIHSHYRAYTINCFVFLKETNTSSVTPGNEAIERTGSQRKGSKQKQKDGLAERPPNSLSGVHERLLQIPQKTKGFRKLFGNEATG